MVYEVQDCDASEPFQLAIKQCSPIFTFIHRLVPSYAEKSIFCSHLLAKDEVYIIDTLRACPTSFPTHHHGNHSDFSPSSTPERDTECPSLPARIKQ